jgi:hypothetical protein
MNHRLFLSAVSLAAVLVASSCAPAGTSVPVPPTIESSLPLTAAPVDPSPITEVSPTQTVNIEAAPTSRGPNLEATDPTTVSLASGQLQLVEFFRFT